MAHHVEMYIKPTCPFCIKAQKLLDQKGVSYEVYNIAGKDDLREEMIQRAGGRKTVPQIFINNEHVGGCDDLCALDRQGDLDVKLRA